jgi:formate/nitrite transporter FocA (FNT family)
MNNPFRFLNIKSRGQSDPSQLKEVNEILDEQIDMGLREFKRPSSSLFLSSFTAGLEIGFSVLFMGTIFTLFHESLDESSLKMSLALCYPIGFIFVIIGRSELFTEQTALAFLPVLRGSVSIIDLFRLWGIVYSGNLVGGYLFALLIAYIGPQVGFINEAAFQHLGHELTHKSGYVIFLSALLAGWMMGLLGWLITSSRDTISRILVIIFVTFIIGLAGLHHCIVGSIEVFAGLLKSPNLDLSDYLKFQVWATAGNAIGGSFFVAILKYSHVRSN